MKRNATTVEGYLSALPGAQRDSLQALRSLIKTCAPKAEEMIRSGVPAFHLEGRYLVSYGAAKSHISLYVMRGDALKRLAGELATYETSNKVIRFTPDKPLPHALVKRIVAIRIEEIAAGRATP